MEKEKEQKKEAEKVESLPVVEDKNLESVVSKMSTVNPDIDPPSPSVVPEIQESPVKKRRKVKGVTDKFGRTFSPELHEVDEQGKPRISKKHGFVVIKRGRKAEEFENGGEKKESVKDKANKQENFQALPPLDDSVNRRNASKASAMIFIKLGVMFFGDEWYPQRTEYVNEEVELTAAFDQYYAVKGIEDIPPGAALALGLLGYAASRVHLPKTRSKVALFFDWMKKSVWNFFKNLKFGRKKNAAYTDSRNDGKRENNTGAETSEKIQSGGNPGLSA